MPRKKAIALQRTLGILPSNLSLGSIDPMCKFRSPAERQFAMFWVENYPLLHLWHDYLFVEDRQFKFDFASPSKIAIEIQGGVFVSGLGHSSGRGIVSDSEKMAIAAQHGWTVLHLPGHLVEDDEAVGQIAKAIKARISS